MVMLRLTAICLAILPYVHAFSVTLPMAGSSLQEGDSFTVGWILGPSGTVNINLVTGSGEPYTTVASLKTGVSSLQLLTSVTIPNNVPAGAYYIQVGDAPNDAIGGPYKVTTNPTAISSSIPTALSSAISSIATASISTSANMSSSSVPLTSSASLTSSTPSGSSITASSATSSSTDSLVTNSNSAGLGLQKSSSSNGGMIGGIVGGVAAIILIPGSFLLWRRNKKRQQQQEMSNAVFWDQPPSHDHDDGPSWGYPSSLKYSNSPGPGSYDPGLHQDTMTPYSQGYYDNYNMPAAAAIGGMHAPPPAATRDAAMAGAYYNGPYPTVDDGSKFQENEKIHLADDKVHLADDIQHTQKPDQI